MKGEKWFEKMLDSVKDSFDFRLETIILNLTEQICRRMQERGITRKQLAQTLRVSPAAITKILNGNPNFTIKTLLSLADALHWNLEIRFVSEVTSCQIQPARFQLTSTNSSSDLAWGAGATFNVPGAGPVITPSQIN